MTQRWRTKFRRRRRKQINSHAPHFEPQVDEDNFILVVLGSGLSLAVLLVLI